MYPTLSWACRAVRVSLAPSPTWPNEIAGVGRGFPEDCCRQSATFSSPLSFSHCLTQAVIPPVRQTWSWEASALTLNICIMTYSPLWSLGHILNWWAASDDIATCLRSHCGSHSLELLRKQVSFFSLWDTKVPLFAAWLMYLWVVVWLFFFRRLHLLISRVLDLALVLLLPQGLLGCLSVS